MCDEISVKISKYDSSPNSSQENSILDEDRRIDGRTDVINVIVAFHDRFAKRALK